jgi:Fuc2NAc and GlcNAc transferase
VTVFIAVACMFVASWALTGCIRRYAVRAGILDVPNQRSSHVMPTPRGGGAGFASAFGAGLLLLIALFPESRPLCAALLGGGALIVAVGWLDDRKGLSSLLRLIVHLVAAVWVVACLKGLPRVNAGIGIAHLGLWGYPAAVLGIAWSTNLYNFMDGIDGLAGGHAVIVGLAAGVLASISGDWAVATGCWFLAAAVAGFLVWNWPPAKIFMGDVGSGLLGFVFATLALASENRGTLPLLVWIMLLLPFVVDTTATLVWRLRRGEKWNQAHRSHAYQRAVQSGYSHLQVTLAILGLDAILALMSYIGSRVPELLIPLMFIATIALTSMWWYFTAIKQRKSDERHRVGG